MSEFTPGPWNAEKPFVSIGRWDIKNNEGNEVTKIWAKGSNRAEANARLIAAAPEMYDVLKLALKAFKKKDWLTTDGAMSEIIETVLDKAEGRRE